MDDVDMPAMPVAKATRAANNTQLISRHVMKAKHAEQNNNAVVDHTKRVP